MTRNTLMLAAALAAVTAVIVLLLSAGWSLGWWLLAAFLLVHGCVHLFFVMPQTARAAESGRRFGLTPGETHMVGSTLMAAAAIGFLFAALLTIAASGLWGPVIVISSLASLAMLGFFFSRTLVMGVGVDLVLLVVALTGFWRP